MATHPPKDIQDVHHGPSPPDDGIEVTAGDHAELPNHTSAQPASTSAAIVQPQARGIAAQKVFGTGELLEETLSYLDPADILNAMAVQRHWRDSIEGSIKLKRLLGLAPGGKFFYSPIVGSSTSMSYGSGRISARPMRPNHGFLSCTISHPRKKDQEFWSSEEDEGSYHLHLGFHAVARDDPIRYLEEPEPLLQDPGSRVRDMAVCNPPLMSITAGLECWCCSYQYDRDGHDSYGPIHATSERGFTIGELADALLSLARTKHRKCSDRCFDLRGLVDIDPDDPIAKSFIFERAAAETKQKYKDIIKEAFQTQEERDRKFEKRPSSPFTSHLVDEDLKKRAATLILPWKKPGKGPEMFEYEFNSDDEEGCGDGEEFMESEYSGTEQSDEDGDAEEGPDDDDDAEENIDEPEHQATKPRSEADDGNEDHDEEVHSAVGNPSVQHWGGSAHDEWDGVKQTGNATW